MKYTTRQLVYIALFGTVWGGIEMTLGSYLHVLNVPQAGTIMTAMGIVILLVGRTFVPRRGATVLMGLVTAFLKMLSVGGIVLNPMIAIFMESLLVEVGLGRRGLSRGRFILAGTLGASWNIVHPFFTQGLLAGWGISRVYTWLLGGVSRLLGIDPRYTLLLILALLAIKSLSGAVAGFVGWEMARAVRKRMGGERKSDLGVETLAEIPPEGSTPQS